jgi:hypothetical protein
MLKRLAGAAAIAARAEYSVIKGADLISAYPQDWIEEIGEVELIAGWAEVRLRDEFAGLVDTEHYQVFLTSYGPVVLFVQDRTARGFEIHSLPATRSKRKFSTFCGYRVVAQRKAPRDDGAR